MRGERDRRIANLALQHPERGIRGERQRAGQQAIEEHTDRIEIRASIDFLAEDLLGRHVRRRAHQAEVHGLLLGAEDPGDSEVHDLDRAFVGHHDVGRLDVTVDDAGAMRMLERRQDQIDDVGRSFGRDRADRSDSLSSDSPRTNSITIRRSPSARNNS